MRLTAQHEDLLEEYIDASEQLWNSSVNLPDSEYSKIHIELSAKKSKSEAAMEALLDHGRSHIQPSHNRARAATSE